MDLTEPKAAVQGTSYLSNLLDASEAKINHDERSFCTNKSFVCGYHAVALGAVWLLWNMQCRKKTFTVKLAKLSQQKCFLFAQSECRGSAHRESLK